MLLQCPDCGNGLAFVVPGAHYTCRCGTVLIVGTLPGDESGSRTRLLSERRQRLAGSSPALAADEQQGYDLLMACLMHSDDVRCEVCGDDKS